MLFALALGFQTKVHASTVIYQNETNTSFKLFLLK